MAKKFIDSEGFFEDVSYEDVSEKPTTYRPPVATATTLGGIKVGSGLSVTVDGTLSATGGGSSSVSSVNNQSPDGSGNVSLDADDIPGLSTVGKTGSYDDLTDKPEIPSPYELPPATDSTIGGVKPGTGLTVDVDGTLNASGSGGGTVTSVGIEPPTGMTASAAITSSGDITLAWYNQVQYSVLAGPLGNSPAAPTFRYLSEGDIPSLSTSKIGSGTFPVSRGGTGVGTLTGYVKGSGTSALTASATIPWTDLSGVPVTFTPPVASSSVLGGVKQGSGVTIDGDGTINVSGGGSLSPATTTTLGGVIVGAGLSVEVDGTIKAGNRPPSQLAWSVTITIDATVANVFYLPMDGTVILSNPTGLVDGQYLELILKQGVTGSMTINSWGTMWKFPGGLKPTLSTEAGAIDVIKGRYQASSSSILCTFEKGFA